MKFSERLDRFLSDIKTEHPNVGTATLKRLLETFTRGYNEGFQDSFVDVTRRESEPIEEHKVGEKLL